MNAKQAIQVRKKIASCASCQVDSPPKVSVMREPVDVVMWLRSSRTAGAFEQLVSAMRTDVLVADDRVCSKHRKLMMRKTRALFEVEFHADGATSEVLPSVGKGKYWFTFYWKLPNALKKDERAEWVQQGRKLGAVVRGQDKMPRMPKAIKGLTGVAAREQLKWDLGTKGYSKVYLDSVGESVVIVGDRDVVPPQGVHSGVPQFTLGELTKLRYFVGMQPDPEMIRGVWLLKKHLKVDVLK